MWIVLLPSSSIGPKAYGPFDSSGLAEKFAAFVTAEIDPAVVVPLTLPIWELLAWRDAMRGDSDLDAAADQLVANGLLIDADVYPAPKPLNSKTAAAAPTTTADESSEGPTS